MASIYVRSGSTPGWRDENYNAGYEKFKKNSANSFGWHLPNDAGTYFCNDGGSIGWRYKTYLTIHGTDSIFVQDGTYGSIQTKTYTIQSSAIYGDRRIVGIWHTWRHSIINVTADVGGTGLTTNFYMATEFNAGCGYFIITIPSTIPQYSVLTISITRGTPMTGTNVGFGNIVGFSEISGGDKIYSGLSIGDGASGTIYIPSSTGYIQFSPYGAFELIAMQSSMPPGGVNLSSIGATYYNLHDSVGTQDHNYFGRTEVNYNVQARWTITGYGGYTQAVSLNCS